MATDTTFFDNISIEMANDIKIYIISDFWDKHLSGNLMFKGITEKKNTLIINPRNYDTAWFIKTQRSNRFSKESGGVIRYTSGSYANTLNKYGSEIEVFKKKSNLPPSLQKKTIAELSEQHLERVKIYIGNHQNYITNAVLTSVDKIRNRYKGQIQEVKIWLVN